jgi:hypothetical protein
MVNNGNSDSFSLIKGLQLQSNVGKLTFSPWRLHTILFQPAKSIQMYDSIVYDSNIRSNK